MVMYTIYFLKVASEHLPRVTSSVIADKLGSINANINLVAKPLMNADKLLAVVRYTGFKYDAYTADNTPIVRMDTATIFKMKILHGNSLSNLISETLVLTGMVILSLK